MGLCGFDGDRNWDAAIEALSQRPRPQRDRAAHARAERGEGGGQALRARAIASKAAPALDRLPRDTRAWTHERADREARLGPTASAPVTPQSAVTGLTPPSPAQNTVTRVQLCGQERCPNTGLTFRMCAACVDL
jgi:hypothetical protein